MANHGEVFNRCHIFVGRLTFILVRVDLSVEKMDDLLSRYFIGHKCVFIPMLGIFGLGVISSIIEPDFTILAVKFKR